MVLRTARRSAALLWTPATLGLASLLAVLQISVGLAPPPGVGLSGARASILAFVQASPPWILGISAICVLVGIVLRGHAELQAEHVLKHWPESPDQPLPPWRTDLQVASLRVRKQALRDAERPVLRIEQYRLPAPGRTLILRSLVGSAVLFASLLVALQRLTPQSHVSTTLVLTALFVLTFGSALYFIRIDTFTFIVDEHLLRIERSRRWLFFARNLPPMTAPLATLGSSLVVRVVDPSAPPNRVQRELWLADTPLFHGFRPAHLGTLEVRTIRSTILSTFTEGKPSVAQP